MIKGVLKSPLKIVSLNDGNVMHAMKSNDQGYTQFGEAYFSIINSGAIKGWKRHKKMICNFIVPRGKIKVVIYEEKEKVFEKFIMSTENYFRLTIPTNLWVGFQGIHSEPSLLLNIASIEHDPDEVDIQDLDFLNYDWAKK